MLTETPLSRISLLEHCETLADVIHLPSVRFHRLKGSFAGLFAMDVKTRKEPWRINLEPLDEDEKAFVPCDIGKIAGKTRIVLIREVSRHYE